MAFSLCCVLLLSVLAPIASPLPHNAVESTQTRPAGGEQESSGDGPNEPPAALLLLRRGVAKVVRLDHRLQPPSGLFKRGAGMTHRGSPVGPFPAFLSRGRVSTAGRPAGGPPHHPKEKESPGALEMRKRQGLHMWQQAVSKDQHPGKVSLALSLKEARQRTCTAIPFTQRVSIRGCEAVTLHNKLCFGQCSSLFIPSGAAEEEEGEEGEEEEGEGEEREEREEREQAGGRARRGACSRCSPSRSHAARVPLRCGSRGLLEKTVMVVEECRCETGQDEAGPGAVEAVLHL
ncbi:hypothetical protein NHX12_018842 [Muraenolepis orangiensis]|uniref:CTCK domain-containing protein n=1 Tax=Muraenolepis orangiensis TaxID=630683 RepID=A0A9Q0EXZ7_9TELE|nr:hypothetical protein NHX12_018842 [Muraenolepis orangiensis]